MMEAVVYYIGLVFLVIMLLVIVAVAVCIVIIIWEDIKYWIKKWLRL